MRSSLAPLDHNDMVPELGLPRLCLPFVDDRLRGRRHRQVERPLGEIRDEIFAFLPAYGAWSLVSKLGDPSSLAAWQQQEKKNWKIFRTSDSCFVFAVLLRHIGKVFPGVEFGSRFVRA